MSRSSSSDTRFAATLDAGQPGNGRPVGGSPHAVACRARTNPYLVIKRQFKVDALVSLLDTWAQTAGKDLSDPAVAEVMAEAARGYSAQDWAALAQHCGVRVPSATTQAEVIRAYEHRAINLAIDAEVARVIGMVA